MSNLLVADFGDAGHLRRLQALDELLPTLAGVLDVREVFARISEIAQRVLAHDMVALMVVDEDRESVFVHAAYDATHQVVSFPSKVRLDDHHRRLLERGWDTLILDDIQQDPIEKATPPGQYGLRSILRVAITLEKQIAAVLDFGSFAPASYTAPDALIGRRIADHVALALSHQRLAEEAQRAAEARERAALLEGRVEVLTNEVESLGGHRRIVGDSPAWKDVLKQATQVAPTDTTVLLLGESGTGKEVVARFIHRASARKGGPFVALNCAALPEHLLESELFGYERGAFTGALATKPGQIEQAAGGVLFLDEIGEMSLAAQAKFLRVLQEREFQSLGGTRVLKAHVRVLAATNRDLSAGIARGTFREDLFYRLNVFGIVLPPLRERREDILTLSRAFLQDIGRQFGRPPAGISREARELLLQYHWPGNVRQLRNTLERAAILCEGALMTGEHLSLEPRPASPAPVRPASRVAGAGSDAAGAADLKSMERAAIERALRESRHNKSRAAKVLGLTRTQLYVRLRKYGMD